jgi:hypothetical protein
MFKILITGIENQFSGNMKRFCSDIFNPFHYSLHLPLVLPVLEISIQSLVVMNIEELTCLLSYLWKNS